MISYENMLCSMIKCLFFKKILVENEESSKLNHQVSIDSSPCITGILRHYWIYILLFVLFPYSNRNCIFADGVEDCVGGSIMGISPAALTGCNTNQF